MVKLYYYGFLANEGAGLILVMRRSIHLFLVYNILLSNHFYYMINYFS